MFSRVMYALQAVVLLGGCAHACVMHGDYIPDPNEGYHISLAQHRQRSVARQVNTQKYKISNVYVFDGYNYTNELSSVITDGGVIGTDDLDAVEIDGKNGTLLPGLFDSHNHPSSLDDLRNLSAYGITTTMCKSCFLSDLCSSLRNQPGLTDFYSAGWSATVVGSSHFKQNGNNTAAAIYNVSMCPEWTENRLETGSNYIKLVADNKEPTLSLQEHIALVKSAHALGLKTATHATIIAAYQTAIESKTDLIQHIPDDALLNTTLIQAIVANKQHVTPTLQAFLYASKAFGLPEAEENLALNNTSKNAKLVYDAGVPILAGTDSTTHTTYPVNIPFGSSLHKELELLVQAGIPELEVLKAATSRPAQVYNLTDRGVIAPGKRADLLLIQGNPLTNISKTQEIQKIWMAGTEYTGGTD